MLNRPCDIYILTNGFGTPESGYATLSKFCKSLTNEGAKPPSWLIFPKTWIMLHNHSRAFQNQLLIILSHERKTGEILKKSAVAIITLHLLLSMPT